MSSSWLQTPKPLWEPSGFRSDLLFSRLATGNVTGMRQLLKVDRDFVTMGDGRGRAPIICAQFLEDDATREAVTQLLVDFEASHTARDPETGLDALGWACRLGRGESVAILLEFAAFDVNYLRGQDGHGNSYLHLAAASGSQTALCQVADAMIRLGLSVDAPRNHQGLSPFLFALKEGQEAMAEILVDRYKAQSRQFDDQLRHDETGWRQVGARKRRCRERQVARAEWARHRMAGHLILAPSRLPSLEVPRPTKRVRRGALPMAELLSAWAEQKANSWRAPAKPQTVLLGEAEQPEWLRRPSNRKIFGKIGATMATRSRHSITDPLMVGARRWRAGGDQKRKQSLQIGHIGEGPIKTTKKGEARLVGANGGTIAASAPEE